MKPIDCKGKLKVGQKVKEVRKNSESNCSGLKYGKETTVTYLCLEGISFNNCYHEWDDDIELDLPPSWDNLQVGMTLTVKDGKECKVLEVGASGKTFLRSFHSTIGEDWEATTGCWLHVEEAQRIGWKIKEEKEVQEMTVEEVSKLVGKTVKIVEK
jgi:hypothetical protein